MALAAGAGTALRGQSAGFAYVANNQSNDVSAYAIDGMTGALAPVAGSPFPAGSYPRSVTTPASPPPAPVTATKFLVTPARAPAPAPRQGCGIFQSMP